MDPDQEDLGTTSFQVTFTGTFSGSVPQITFDKSGISATVQTHNTFGIGATFDITNASVGSYVVTVTDTGGSDTANLTLVPFINSIEPAGALAGTSVPVTISGKGFGTAPTLTLGGGITASNINASDTQITATFNIPAGSVAQGDQTLTVTNQGFATQGDTFFVQIPKSFVRFNSPATPGGFGPVVTLTNGNVVDLAGNVLLTNQCGVYENFLFELVDQQGSPITNGIVTVTEVFSNISNPPGPTPSVNTLNLNIPQGEQDTQSFSHTAPTCLATNENQSFDMTWTVQVGSQSFPLSTIVHISKGNFNGTLNVTSSITAP
jgi:hypothetical protein